MLRITILSLLLGALTVITGLTIFFPPGTVNDQGILPIIWNADLAQVELGAAESGAAGTQVNLGTRGLSRISLVDRPFAAQDYPFLHLALDESGEDLNLVLTWESDATSRKRDIYTVQSKSTRSLWLATEELRGWTGNIDNLSLVLAGQANDIVQIRDFSLLPASPLHQLRAIVSDLTGYVPWTRAAMNSHTGVTKVSSFYPVALTLAFLALSLVAYAVLLLLLRSTQTFNLRVVALIFLASWISLDMVWQHQLLRQVADTYRTFTGKSTQERLAVGPDAKLFNFISEVRRHLEPGARVIVNSSDRYMGMRGAYYLYPYNVYWSMHSPEMPPFYFLRSGDYIVLIKPTTTRFNRHRNTLTTSENPPSSAESVFRDRTGELVRLN